jgi:hypothetical protein
MKDAWSSGHASDPEGMIENEKKCGHLWGKTRKGQFEQGSSEQGQLLKRRHAAQTEKLTPVLFQRHQQKGWEIQANKRMYFIHSSEIWSFHGLYRKLWFKCVINLATMWTMTGVYFGHVFKNFVGRRNIRSLHYTLNLCCNISTYRVHSLRRFLGLFPRVYLWVNPRYSLR